MEITFNEISINLISESNSVPSNRTPILFLHGFTGSCNDWLFIFSSLNSKYFPIAIDLPGHGATTVPDNREYFSTTAHIDIVKIVLDYFKITKLIIVGYSMGGRIALSFASKFKENLLGLILESSTPGITNKFEREKRIETDYLLADKLLEEGINSFIDYWISLPFFNSLNSLDILKYNKLIETKKMNSPIGLSNSLKGFSTGIMPNLWDSLPFFNIPTLLISGNVDKKFVQINKNVNQLIPNATLEIIENCGHNTHLENPEKFTILVNNFLNNLEKR